MFTGFRLALRQDVVQASKSTPVMVHTLKSLMELPMGTWVEETKKYQFSGDGGFIKNEMGKFETRNGSQLNPQSVMLPVKIMFMP